MSTWTRHGLSFSSDPPNSTPIEHLDVLVLNGSTYFIDFRVRIGAVVELLPASASSASDSGSRMKGDLDWAFGGTRLEGKRGESEGGSTYCKWSTTICSRSPPPQPILLDEGQLHFDPVNPSIFYERGSMTHPITSISSPGEEVWHSLPRTNSERMIFLEREDGGGFLGMIGENRLGVGRKGEGGKGEIWAWRGKGNERVYGVGECEGEDVLEMLSGSRKGSQDEVEGAGEEAKVGDLIKDKNERKWIVREYVKES